MNHIINLNGFFRSNEYNSPNDINFRENGNLFQNSSNFNIINILKEQKPQNWNKNINGKNTVIGNEINDFNNFNDFITNGFFNDDFDNLKNKNLFETKYSKLNNIDIINNNSFPLYININEINEQNDKRRSNNLNIFSKQNLNQIPFINIQNDINNNINNFSNNIYNINNTNNINNVIFTNNFTNFNISSLDGSKLININANIKKNNINVSNFNTQNINDIPEFNNEFNRETIKNFKNINILNIINNDYLNEYKFDKNYSSYNFLSLKDMENKNNNKNNSNINFDRKKANKKINSLLKMRKIKKRISMILKDFAKGLNPHYLNIFVVK